MTLVMLAMTPVLAGMGETRCAALLVAQQPAQCAILALRLMRQYMACCRSTY